MKALNIFNRIVISFQGMRKIRYKLMPITIFYKDGRTEQKWVYFQASLRPEFKIICYERIKAWRRENIRTSVLRDKGSLAGSF
jgi:hypothetical protein